MRSSWTCHVQTPGTTSSISVATAIGPVTAPSYVETGDRTSPPKTGGGLRDQSHLDDMRAAVRGDRERAEARRRAEQERSSASDAGEAPQPSALDPAQPEPELSLQQSVARDLERRSRWARLFRR